jgi:hypothetical protein
MKRREFVTLSARLAGALASRAPLCAQQIKSRAAVVIGVDKAGNLPRLGGAASGARQVANWLDGEGFDVAIFADGSGPVRVNDVYDAIARYVHRGTVEQLVVYFAGHGFISHYSEFWMLSNAPENPNEAVSLLESIELARASAIPNVVFISDACRSQAETVGGEHIRGSLIFPNPSASPPSVADVDVFLATGIGQSALEVQVPPSAPQYEGIYTASFLSAFSHPDGSMVRSVGGVRVVPNNHLKAYLEREVRRRAEAIAISYQQVPDTRVVSGDTTYIGRVTGSVDYQVSVSEQLTIHDVASVELARVGVRSAVEFAASREKINRAEGETGYASAAAAIQRPSDASLLERTGGLVVTGARLRTTVAHPSVHIEMPPAADGQTRTSLVRVDLRTASAGSVALQFDDGGGTVVAGLNGFVANVTVSQRRVVNVSYVPAPRTDLWYAYDSERARIDDLHATVATAARLGVFRIEATGRDERARAAERLASRIRVLKGIDPTLGLYAAYAYSDAGLPSQIRSVREIMRRDLGADVFDVAMLSGELTGKNLAGNTALYPFCPMLSQGWNMLRVKDVRVAREVNAARDHLLQALWTTFDHDGMDMLMGALREGRLH